MNLSDLYQELILDHSRHPRLKGRVAHPTHHANGHNPLCGDKVSVTLTVSDAGVIDDIRFEGEGCAISMASASLMSEALLGKNVRDVPELFEPFHHLLTQEAPLSASQEEQLDKLMAFAGVREFPMRVKCATMAWHTVKEALESRK